MSSSRHYRWARLWAFLTLATLGCTATDSLLSPGLVPPSSVHATAISMSGIRLDWQPQEAGVLDKYRIESRQDLGGKFRLLAEVNPNATSYFDTGLEADRFYGYRIVAVSREGQQSDPSVVAGAHTAPLPGVEFTTGTSGGTDPAIADPNGYRITLTGPKDTSISIGTFDDIIVFPLPAGEYTVTLSDILSTCLITGDTVRHLTIVDTGLVTRAGSQYSATCTDPARGRIVSSVVVDGDSTDSDGYQVNYAGIITGDPVPVLGGVQVLGTGGTVALNGLRPGEYEVTLADVDLPCTLVSGGATITVAPQSVDTVNFAVTCPDKSGGSVDAPLVYRNVWNPASVASGGTANLDVTLDLGAKPGQTLGVIQATVLYDPALLTFVRAETPAGGLLGTPVVNSSTPGALTWLGVGATGPSGVIPAARFVFTAAGASGTSARTRTTIELTADASGGETLDTLFRVVEDTLAIGAGGGPGNQSPTAEANGPYSGAAGSPITLSSAGSIDADGTISSYAWAFSDGSTATGASPSKSFSAAGSFTVTLTVTDDDGATGTDQATITITGGGGGGNQNPVAQLNGPYAGAPNVAISFSSAGSSDPDGSIASYAWTFGDNSSSTVANPSKSYTAAGSYSVTLTVTDNQGATAQAQTTATVTASSTGPVWSSNFGPLDPAFQAYPLQISLNLTQDLAQTPGPEAVQSFTVDSLVWDPAVLQYHSLIFGSGGGSFNTTDAVGGCKCKLTFSGNPTSNTGVVNIARVLFKAVGTSGSQTTLKTSLGPVLSTPSNGSFNYRSVMTVTEGSLTLP